MWAGDRQVTGFESQKVRALLAYLVCHRQRTFSRDHLIGLLWPERDPETARHTLRQALYNLRSTVPGGGTQGLVQSRNLEIGLSPEADCWLDVEAFEEALEGESVDPQQLSAAAQLYRGEFLAGFFVKDSPAFEDWLGTQQVRFREAAVEVLQRLIESYRRRGEYRFGVHYARRLVALEPLLEEAHRNLMRLLALSGQRSRALAQYEDLTRRLRDELAVEPAEETRQLYDSILAEALEVKTEASDPEPIGPIIPLVGRGPTYGLLREGWLRALAGKVHFTLLTGESGVGKTRLLKSFLDTTTSQRRGRVLKARCYELAPLQAYQPFAEVLRSVLADATDVAERALARVPAAALADLVRLAPELRDLRPDLSPPAPSDGADGQRRLFTAFGRFLEALCRQGSRGEEPEPLILYLDDLHLADRDSFDLLAFLTARLKGPIWILASSLGHALEHEHPLGQIFRQCKTNGMGTRLTIDRLAPDSLEEIAESLVGEAEALELARFLAAKSGGLPLAVAEIINLLWDEGVLTAQGAGRWSLTRPLAGLDLAAETLQDLIRIRLRRLPNSTRRLATLAAVMGRSFDAHLLQEAADEHVAVVEVGLEILLRRWLIRQFFHSWTSGRQEEVLAMWAQGARRGSFEFAHREIRRAILDELNPLRRQVMHAQVAEALARLRGDRDCESLAYHFMAAGEWEKALPALEGAVERALSLGAEDTARRYYDQAVEVLSRLVATARNDAQAERWREERGRLLERMRGTIPDQVKKLSL